MRYKVEVTTFNNGNKLYQARYKRKGIFNSWHFVVGVVAETADCILQGRTCLFVTREDVLKAIDEHHGRQVSSIEFEYINK